MKIPYVEILRASTPDGRTDTDPYAVLPVWAQDITYTTHQLLNKLQQNLVLLATIEGVDVPNSKANHAFVFAALRHQDQLRKDDATPYIFHNIRILDLYLNNVASQDLLPEQIVDGACAVFLHDVVEDCGVTYKDLSIEFGDIVTELVFWLSEETKERCGNRRLRKKLAAQKIAAAPELAKFIKVLDIFDNSYCCAEFFTPTFFELFHLEKKEMLESIIGSENPATSNIAYNLWVVCRERLSGLSS